MVETNKMNMVWCGRQEMEECIYSVCVCMSVCVCKISDLCLM